MVYGLLSNTTINNLFIVSVYFFGESEEDKDYGLLYTLLQNKF
jgi:hypothetical protein